MQRIVEFKRIDLPINNGSCVGFAL